MPQKAVDKQCKHMAKVAKIGLVLALSCGLAYGCADGNNSRYGAADGATGDYVQTKDSPRHPRMRATLNRFVKKVRSNDDFDHMYLGDRLLILSDTMYNEVFFGETNKRYVPLTYGCGDTCGLTLKELAELLDSHLNSPTSREADAPAALVRAWPSITLVNGSTVWKISFGMNGDTLVSVEVFGPVEGVRENPNSPGQPSVGTPDKRSG